MIPTHKRIRLILLLAVVVEYFVIMYTFLTLRLVKADSYFPNAEMYLSGLSATYTLGYELPQANLGISYQQDMVSGYQVGQLSQRIFQELAYGAPMYTRVVSPQDSMVLPPGSDVYLGTHMYNNTGHTVGITNTWLFMGRYNTPQLTDVVEVLNVQYRNIAYQVEGMLLTKGGQSIELGPLGNIAGSADGLGTSYYRSFLIGKVKTPVTISNTVTACGIGNSVISLSFLVKNTGLLQENIELEGKTLAPLAPHEERQVELLLPNIGQTTSQVLIKNSVTRCLRKGTGAPYYGVPDGHALVIARNDDGHWLWNGILLNVPSLDEREQFCVTRMPYSIPISLPVCIQPPQYEVTFSTKQTQLHAGEVINIPVEIKNNGGDDVVSAQVSVVVKMPENWQNLITFIRSDGNGLTITGAELSNSGITFSGLKGGESYRGYFQILAPSILTTSMQNSFSLEMVKETTSVISEVIPIVESSVTVTAVHEVCMDKKSGIRVQYQVLGNSEISKISIPLSLVKAREKAFPVLVTWKQGKGIFYLNNQKNSIVDLIGLYKPGVYELYVTTKEPLEDKKRIEVAVSGRTATLYGKCPVREELDDNESKDSDKESDKEKIPERSVLGKLTTINQVSNRPEVMAALLEITPVIVEKLPLGIIARISLYTFVILLFILASIAVGAWCIGKPRKVVSR